MQTGPAHESSDSKAPEARWLGLFDHAERIGGLGSWEWIPQAVAEAMRQGSIT